MTAPTAQELLEFMYWTPVALVKFNPSGMIEMANPAAAQLLMPLISDADMTDLYCVLADVAPDLSQWVASFVAPTGQICDEVQLAVPGSRVVFSLSINKIDPNSLMAVIKDISQATEQERRLRADQQRFQAIFENVRDYAIYTTDLEGRVDSWNRSLARVGGWQAADVVGLSIRIFFPEEEQRHVSNLLDRARRFGMAELETWRVRKDGTRFWGNTIATALPDPSGSASGFVLVTRDLTDRKLVEDHLRALSITDTLTGGLNRRAAEARLDEVFGSWQRNGRVFAALMIDCDHFKQINDRCGHEAGDEVLMTLVRICQENLREPDVIYRWGGEEFMVVLPKADRQSGFVVAERLRLALAAASLEFGKHTIKITVSIGVTEVAEADTGPEDVVRRIDQALYRAKASGRNRVATDQMTGLVN